MIGINTRAYNSIYTNSWEDMNVSLIITKTIIDKIKRDGEKITFKYIPESFEIITD